MSAPFYVSPEQVMADKAEYARKGISRGKSSITFEYADGILIMAENTSSLSKIGEIYDRIAFAGVGKFSEFDQLRKVGVRFADMKGYQYSRDDVRGRALANAYSQAIGEVFTPANTTLVAVATDAEIHDRDELRRLGIRAHDAIAATIRPSHTRYDGDSVFVVSAGRADADIDRLGEATFSVVASAIVRAVTTETP